MKKNSTGAGYHPAGEALRYRQQGKYKGRGMAITLKICLDLFMLLWKGIRLLCYLADGQPQNNQKGNWEKTGWKGNWRPDGEAKKRCQRWGPLAMLQPGMRKCLRDENMLLQGTCLYHIISYSVASFLPYLKFYLHVQTITAFSCILDSLAEALSFSIAARRLH